MNTVSGTPRPAQDSLGPWEIPAQCVLEGVEVFQMGRYGPTCKGQLKQENTSTAVVIKTLKGTNIIFLDKLPFTVWSLKCINK